MPSFEFDIGEKERAGSRFLSDVRDELQRALAIEKSQRKITQQEIANLLETSRAVINRQIVGFENIGIKRVAEILWAIGWEPHFEARRVPESNNAIIRPAATAPREPIRDNRRARVSALDDKKKDDKDKVSSAAEMAYAEQET
jgi:hypothetical protein